MNTTSVSRLYHESSIVFVGVSNLAAPLEIEWEIYAQLVFQVGPKIDQFLLQLTASIANHDPEKEKLLFGQEAADTNTTCYRTCLLKFSETCVEEDVRYSSV